MHLTPTWEAQAALPISECSPESHLQICKAPSPRIFLCHGKKHSQVPGMWTWLFGGGGHYSAAAIPGGEPSREARKPFRMFRNWKESAVAWRGQRTGLLARAGSQRDSSAALCAVEGLRRERFLTFQSRGGTPSGLRVRRTLSAIAGS